MNILFNWKNLFVAAIMFVIIGLSLNENVAINIEIKGFVKNPGVYKISDELTVNDAIELAGGLKEEANISQINLSKKVYDEMVIIIPSNEEIAELTKGTTIKYIENECMCPKIINDSCITLNPDDDIIIESTKISLNNATKEELMTLSGIGESKALAIIEYRRANKFKSIEEIMNVKGIGKSIYEKIKDNISI